MAESRITSPANVRIHLPEEELLDFCKRWKIVELALFGSVLRDDFGPDSDVDMLVRFAPDAAHGLLAHMRAEEELESHLGRPVDLIERTAVEGSHNFIRRRAILGSAETIYAE